MENIIIVLKGLAAAILGGVVHWLGGLDQMLVALIAAVILDYGTGLLSAWHTNTLSSAVGFRGIVKKVMLLGVVALAYLIEELTGGAFPLREITITFFVVNEALSILENAVEVGLPIPQKLRDVLAQLNGNKED